MKRLTEIISKLKSLSKCLKHFWLITKAWLNSMTNTYTTLTKWIKQRLNLKSPPESQQEQEAIVKRASKFDQLVADPGWLEIQDFYAAEINNAILIAANDDPEKAEVNRLHVVRWNAKRELNDAAIHYIEETRRLRDEIVNPPKEENYVHGSSDARPN